MASQSLGAPESLQVELIHRQGRLNGGLPFSLGVSTACAGERKWGRFSKKHSSPGSAGGGDRSHGYTGTGTEAGSAPSKGGVEH